MCTRPPQRSSPVSIPAVALCLLTLWAFSDEVALVDMGDSGRGTPSRWIPLSCAGPERVVTFNPCEPVGDTLSQGSTLVRGSHDDDGVVKVLTAVQSEYPPLFHARTRTVNSVPK